MKHLVPFIGGVADGRHMVFNRSVPMSWDMPVLDNPFAGRVSEGFDTLYSTTFGVEHYQSHAFGFCDPTTEDEPDWNRKYIRCWVFLLSGVDPKSIDPNKVMLYVTRALMKNGGFYE